MLRLFSLALLTILFFPLSFLACGSQSSSGDTPQTIDVAPLEIYQSQCPYDTVPSIDTPQNDNEAIVISDQETLDCQLDYTNQTLEIASSSSSSESISKSFQFSASENSLPQKLNLILVGKVAPPVVNGNSLGASDVFFNGNTAVVTYNTAGESYLGAVQIVDVSTPTNPKVLSQTVFPNRDVSSGLLDEPFLYLMAGEDIDTTGFDSPAEVFKAEVDELGVPDSFSDPVSIPSFVGTDGVLAEGLLFVTSGDQGGLSKMNPEDLSVLDFLDLEDARSVDYDPEAKILYVFQGTPGRIASVNPENLSHETFLVGGANIPESKSTLEFFNGLLFIGAGDQGALIVDPLSTEILATLENPDDASLENFLEVTNAVTAQEDLLFISNGEAGIRAASWLQNEGQVSTSIIGKLPFEENVSANSIAYRGDFLMIAAGTAGLKIVKVVKSPYLQPIDCSLIDAVFCEGFSLPDETRIDDSIVWNGQDKSRHPNGTTVDEGARINKNKYLQTVESFSHSPEGKIYSAKLFKSGVFSVLYNKNNQVGTELRYDGNTKAAAYIGQVNNSQKRITVNFTIPKNQPYVVVHFYREETKVKVVLEFFDGSTLESPEITSQDTDMSLDSVIRLSPFDKEDQPDDAPSFDDILVENYNFPE